MPSLLKRLCCCCCPESTPAVAKNPYAEFDKDDKKKSGRSGADVIEGSISQSPDWIPSPLQGKVKKGGKGGTEMAGQESKDQSNGQNNYYAKKAAKMPKTQKEATPTVVEEREEDMPPPPPPPGEPPAHESDSDEEAAAPVPAQPVATPKAEAEKFDESTKTGALKNKLAAQLGGKIPVFGAPRPVTMKATSSSANRMPNFDPPDGSEVDPSSAQSDSHLSAGSLNSIMKPVKSPRTRGKHPSTIKSFQPSPSNTATFAAPLTLASASSSSNFSQSSSNVHSQPPSQPQSSSKSRPPQTLAAPKSTVRMSIDDSFNPKYQQGSSKAVAKYREANIQSRPPQQQQHQQYQQQQYSGQYQSQKQGASNANPNPNQYQSQKPPQGGASRPPGPGAPNNPAFAGGPPPGKNASRPPGPGAPEPRNRRSSSFDGTWKQKPMMADQTIRGPPKQLQQQQRPGQPASGHSRQPSANPYQTSAGGQQFNGPPPAAQPFAAGPPKGGARPPAAAPRPQADYIDPPSQVSQAHRFDSDSEESDSDEEMPKRKNQGQKPAASWGEAAKHNSGQPRPPQPQQPAQQYRGPPAKPPSLADMSLGSLPPPPNGFNLY